MSIGKRRVGPGIIPCGAELGQILNQRVGEEVEPPNGGLVQGFSQQRELPTLSSIPNALGQDPSV